MALLAASDIIERINQPINGANIANAVAYEEKLRMHSVACTEAPNNQAYYEWLSSIRGMLHPSKYKLFEDSIKYPLKTVPLYQNIYSKLSKVFDANDANKDVFFSENFGDQKELFKEDLKNLSSFWKTEGYQELQTNPCSFVVIDFPEEEKKAEPLHYFVRIDTVVDCVLKKDNVTPEYIIYYVDEETVIAIDDNYRRLFRKSSNVWVQDLEIGDVPNLTEGIPVRSFISTVIDQNPYKKGVKSIASTLGLAEWYLYTAISEDVPVLYALFPDKWKYGETEDYDLEGRAFEYLEDEYEIERNCYGRTKEEQRAFVSIDRGVGSTHTKPIPKEDGFQDVGVPVGYIDAPVTTLQRIEEEVNRRYQSILSVATGQTNGDVQDKQSLNKEQVAALNQGYQTVLQRLSDDFSHIEKWVLDTEGKVRFGEAYQGSIVNNGTTFITLTPNEIEEHIRVSKESGSNESQLKVLYFMWYDSKFKTEPLQAEKYKVLFDIEPFPTHSIEEMQKNYDNGFISRIDWNVKLNFNSYVSRFENEYVKITAMDEDLSIDQKVSFIKPIIFNYGTEAEKKNESANRSGQQSEPTTGQDQS